MTFMKIVKFLRPSLVHLRPNFFLTLDVQLQTNQLPFSNDNNQLKEKIIQGWLLYIIRSFLEVGFRFHSQLINLAWLSFDFFSFSGSLTICVFACVLLYALYSCVFSCPKNIMKCLLSMIIHIFSTYFATNLFYLHNLRSTIE